MYCALTRLWFRVQSLLDERHCHHESGQSSWTLQLFGLEAPRGGAQVEEARCEVVLSWIWQETHMWLLSESLQGREKSPGWWRDAVFSTLQHAVVGLPVHLPQCCPELCGLWTFLHHLHLQGAALAETQLRWTADEHIILTSWKMFPTFTATYSPLKAHPVYVTYVWVRRSTALLLTSLELVWALQPVQRYSTPCWLLSRTTEPLDLRPAQQQSISNRDPSSGSCPRTQNKRHSATTDR